VHSYQPDRWIGPGMQIGFVSGPAAVPTRNSRFMFLERQQCSAARYKIVFTVAEDVI